MERLEKAAVYLEIVAAVLYIIPATITIVFDNIHFVIPQYVFLGLLSFFVGASIFFAAIKIKQRFYIERIEGLKAYLLFPNGIPDKCKTLDFHLENYHKKVLVSFRSGTANAYPLPGGKSSYFWSLIKKYPDLWVSVIDPEPNSDDMKKWCEQQGFVYHNWSPTKISLKYESNDLEPEILQKLKERKKEGKLDDFRIIFLCPWYKYKDSNDFPSKGILQVRSCNAAYDPPPHWFELIKKEILPYTIKVKWPWQKIGSWCKSNHLTYANWPLTERFLAENDFAQLSKKPN